MKDWKRGLRWGGAIALAAALLYLGTAPLLNALAHRLIRRDALAKADVVVALGGDFRCNREKRSAELYLQGLAPKVVVSGVQAAWGIHTADAGRRYVVSLGVPERDVLEIRDTLNTRTEVAALERLMQERGMRSAIIVTSAFHSRRALFTAEKQAPGMTFLSAPVDPVAPEWQPDRWWARRGDMHITIREFLSWGNTWLDLWK